MHGPGKLHVHSFLESSVASLVPWVHQINHLELLTMSVDLNAELNAIRTMIVTLKDDIIRQRDAVSISSVNTYKICSICFTPFCNFPLEETEGEAGETGGKIERREGKLKKQVVGDGEIVVNEKISTRQQAE